MICGAAALSVIIALMFWAKEPDYRVLFSNISDEEGGAIVAQLSQQYPLPHRHAGRDHGAGLTGA